MSRIPFQKPKKVEWEILSDQYGRLVAEPFEKGYALTVGNSLRRTLLSIVTGAAVSWVKIEGVRSVDAKIPGVKESTVDVLLNVKTLAIQVPAVGKTPDHEKLLLEGGTNGGVSPDDALARAATYLKGHFTPLAAGAPEEVVDTEGAGGEAFLRDALAKTLEELALPARAINALKNADINLVVDLVQKSEGDLEHVKNLGEKSIDEIKTALAALGLSLGIRIDPNVLGALGRGGVAR